MTKYDPKTVYERSTGYAESFLRDMQDSDLPQSLRRDFKDSYDFFLDDDARDRLAEMGRFKRWIFSSWYLARGLFLKLTPARRLILLVGLVLAADGSGGDSSSLMLGFGALLFVLGLELKDKLLAHDELAAGRAVQMALMPDASPSVRGWDIWLHTRPANEVGGDLIDSLLLDENRLAIALGDVAGKGLGAALFMARLQATIQALAPSCHSLEELAARVNEVVRRDHVPSRFASLLYAEVVPDEPGVRWVNAGHHPPIHVGADGVESLEKGAPAIGLADETAYREHALVLESDDFLLFYSDGITEARDEAGSFFGEERLLRILPRLRGSSAETAGRRILEEVDLFVDGARASDDLSLAIIRLTGGRLPA